jgi:PBP1b-binding outer membrane lipoprotein LpoB
VNSTSKTRRGSPLRVAAGLAGALLIASCASTPPAPTAQLQAAQQAIATAEQMDAGRHAAVELGEARTKLAAADTAVREEKMEGAARLADESRVAAELAASKTATVKATAVNDEMKRSTGTLIDEMQRTTGDAK